MHSVIFGRRNLVALGLGLWALGLGISESQPAPRTALSQLTWFDRAGKRLGTLGSIADYGNLELSPDGTQVAVAVLDPGERTRDIWLYDVERGGRTRYTSGGSDENWSIWSRDGGQIVFNSQRDGRLDLYRASARSSRDEKVLLAGDEGKWPVSWSPDGRFILYVTNSQRTGNDIMVLPMAGDREPFPFRRTVVSENWAAFSPDGRWIAYSSTESGRAEVYVAPFPAADASRTRRISMEGGSQARWRRDGRELFYLAEDRTLMATTLTFNDVRVDAGTTERLFEARIPYLPYHGFDVAADGQRILMNTLVVSPSTPSTVAANQSYVGADFSRPVISWP